MTEMEYSNQNAACAGKSSADALAYHIEYDLGGEFFRKMSASSRRVNRHRGILFFGRGAERCSLYC